MRNPFTALINRIKKVCSLPKPTSHTNSRASPKEKEVYHHDTLPNRMQTNREKQQQTSFSNHTINWQSLCITLIAITLIVCMCLSDSVEPVSTLLVLFEVVRGKNR